VGELKEARRNPRRPRGAAPKLRILLVFMGRGMMRRLKICFLREVSLTDESTRSQENIKLDSKILIAGRGIFFPVLRDPLGRQTSLRSLGG
jgi:hypothetical protein